MSIKISELPSANSIGDNDIFPIVQSGTTKKIVYSNLKPTIETTIDSSSTNDNGVSPKAVYDYSAPINHASSNTTYGQGSETNYGHCKTINNITSASYVAGESLSAYQGKVLKDELDTKQDISNLTTTIDENSTDVEYPSAKAVYDELVERDTRIEELEQENAQLLDQIPVGTATTTSGTATITDSSNLQLKDIQVLGNATQDDTPTPTTPQDIHVVTGDNTVKIVGKNLFKTSNVQNGYISSTTSYQVNTATKSIYCKVKPNTTYTISKIADQRFKVGFCDELPVARSSITNGVVDNTATTITRTSTENSKYLVAFIYESTAHTNTLEQILNSIQIEEGSIATSYEPYTEQSVTLPLGDIELAGTGTYKDRFFKNTPDSEYYNDTLTEGSWYKLNNVIKRTITNNATITYSQAYDYFNVALPSGYYGVINSTDVLSKIAISTALSEVGFRVRVNNTGSALWYFGANETFDGDVDEFKTYLSTNNDIVYYPKKTPTYTEITDTALISQLEAILNASIYKNTTNFSIEPTSPNATGDLTITYYKDLETMFNNLNNAILSIGGGV